MEPLECTPDGKAWLIMCEYLRCSESFRALLAFFAEWRGGELVKSRLRKYGLLGGNISYAYTVIESSFKEAYPSDFRKGFWASIFG